MLVHELIETVEEGEELSRAHNNRCQVEEVKEDATDRQVVMAAGFEKSHDGFQTAQHG